jgi:DNA-binding transcriptional regulator YdaS (Cro superfamily)
MSKKIRLQPNARMSDNDTINNAVEWAGSQARLASLMAVTRCQISSWVAAGFFPANQSIKLERISKGEFRAVDLFKEDTDNLAAEF